MPILLILTPYLVFAGGLLACLCVLLSFKRDLRQLRRSFDEATARGQKFEERASGELRDLAASVREAEERAGVLVAPARLASGLNLSVRTHAIRLARRGERSQEIAAALGVSRNEVDLLLKVYALTTNVERPPTSARCESEPDGSAEQSRRPEPPPSH